MLRSIGTFFKRAKDKAFFFCILCFAMSLEQRNWFCPWQSLGFVLRGLRPPALTPAGFSVASQPPIYVCQAPLFPWVGYQLDFIDSDHAHQSWFWINSWDTLWDSPAFQELTLHQQSGNIPAGYKFNVFSFTLRRAVMKSILAKLLPKMTEALHILPLFNNSNRTFH